MPGMSGIEATQKLKKIKSFRDIPVIAMTGKPQSEWKKAQAAGCNDWLSKPFRAHDLSKKLLKYLK